MAEGKRPVPSRTRKLSPPAPMVLHPTGCGRVGHRRTSFQQGPVTGALFALPDRVPVTVVTSQNRASQEDPVSDPEPPTPAGPGGSPGDDQDQPPTRGGRDKPRAGG